MRKNRSTYLFPKALTNLREIKPTEKLYMQTDKSNYSTSDTLRFKAYLLNANYLRPAVNIGLLYIELDNEKGKSMKRISATTYVNGIYTLVEQAREILCAQTISINGCTLVTVAKSLFPTGIARFTLFNNNRALNERIIFINHQDNLKVDITNNKMAYSIRDSIALHIQVKHKDGNPVQGSFSVAVTDDTQVKVDSLGSNMEEPNYYFKGNKEAELNGQIGYVKAK